MCLSFLFMLQIHEYLIQKANEEAGQARVCAPPLPATRAPSSPLECPGEGPGGRWGAEDSCAVRTLAWSGGRGKAGLKTSVVASGSTLLHTVGN